MGFSGFRLVFHVLSGVIAGFLIFFVQKPCFKGFFFS